METDPAGQVQVVDPEVRSHIYSIVTALGGSANDEAGRYVLGDDALGCLRDLKKWLRFYDEKMNRMDVARCLAESNIINGDLLPILALWGDSSLDNKYKSRITLACLELLVPLTWPIEHHDQMTVNHHRHTPYLQQAQVSYKRGILAHVSGTILRMIIRIGLPSMTIPRSERSSRDEGILKLMLYLFRNVAVINANPTLAVEGDEDEASRSVTINAFHQQDVFALLLTMCSNMGEEFNFQDIIILDILFHLVKGVDVEELFMDDTDRSATRTDELQELIDAESHMHRSRSKNAPTRHGRFGTMIWVKREDEKLSTVSGQDVLKGDQATFQKMDKTKKWNKPRRRREDDLSINNFNMPVTLTSSAHQFFRTFVEEFLDSGFNPLLVHLRKAMEREAERITDSTSRQFFFVISWFLEAERARRSRQSAIRQKSSGKSREIEPDNYSLVAGVLNQETFIALNRFMQSSMDNKEWQDLNAGMRCFTQILLTVQEMARSPLDEDQEIAENIQSRIFYEESTHDRILSTLRDYKNQGFWYLDACTELAHVFLRMLEQYSKQNSDMQVRSRRRARRKKAKESQPNGDNPEAEENGNSDDEDDAAEIARTTSERSFDFKRFSAKFCTQKSVNTFVALTTYYRELNSEQLKRAHRFFYRVAFKQELSVLLFRLDIVSLFYKMVKGPEGLNPRKPMYREWEELIRQLIKRLVRKIEQRPELITELLFSKIPSTLHYLEYGHEKQTLSSESRPAMELEVKPTAAKNLDERLRIVVSAMMIDGNEQLVRWVCQVLENAVNERKSWELAAAAKETASDGDQPDAVPKPPSIVVAPPDETRRKALFKNGRLRLLMSLSGLELSGEDTFGGLWIIPSSLPSTSLEESLTLIKKHCDDPATVIDDADPHKLIRRKREVDPVTAPYEASMNVDFGSNSEGEDDANLDVLFPSNPRSKSTALEALKKKRRKKRNPDHDEDGENLDEETLEARRLARQENALARQRKIKSDLRVHASDEDSDEEADREFFAREEERRKAQAQRVQDALITGSLGQNGQSKKSTSAGQTRHKRKQTSLSDSDDDDEDDIGIQKKRPRSATLTSGSEDDTDKFEGGLTSPRAATARATPKSTEVDLAFDPGDRLPTPPFRWTSEADGLLNTMADGKDRNGNDGQMDVDEDEDEEPVAIPTRRPRLMAGFVIDSDSE